MISTKTHNLPGESKEHSNSQEVKIKQDFLVLMDFSEASYTALKYTISMAKIIHGHIHIYYAGNLDKIVSSENPLVISEAIKLETTKIEAKLKSIIEILKVEGLSATSHYSFGNITDEFKSHINDVLPDLIIIGKTKGHIKLNKKITSYLLNNYSRSMLVIEKETEFLMDTKITLGYHEHALLQLNPRLVFLLNQHTKTPLTFLNINSKANQNETPMLPASWKLFYDENCNMQFECLENTSIVNGLKNHISKNNVEMLCIGRGKQRNVLSSLFFKKHSSTLSKIIDEIHIPILIMSVN